MSITVPIPERKHDFRVNDMFFWITDSDVMFFRFKGWLREHGVSLIRIEEHYSDGDFLYTSHIKHVFNGDTEYFKADEYRGRRRRNENYRIYKARQEKLSEIEDALLRG